MIPHLSEKGYKRNSYQFTRQSTKGDRAIQQAIAPGFSVVSKGKSKSGRPRKTFGNMRF
jgi:hypothetical protein